MAQVKKLIGHVKGPEGPQGPKGDPGDGTSFEELSYADYKAGNYEPDKAYAIPDFPSSGDALVGEQIFYANFSNKMVYSTYRACVNIPNISRYNVELVSVKVSGNDLSWAVDDNAILTTVDNTLVISTNNTSAQGSPCVIAVNITPKN